MKILLVGALGEVGSSVGRALQHLEHEVLPVSSRSRVSGSNVLALDSAIDMVTGGHINLVVHAGGRGDRREESRDPSVMTQLLGEACESNRVRGVLISTVRVLEDAQAAVPGSATPQCHSAYARANERNEATWLLAAPTYGHVLRLANFLCIPSSVESPQVDLLPWSLVTEAQTTGTITVRSASSVSREFVAPDDVARALLAVGTVDSPARVTSTIPGLRLSLAELTDSVSEAFGIGGFPRPTVSFGKDLASGPILVGDWLSHVGWSSALTPSDVTSMVARWLSEHTSLQ